MLIHIRMGCMKSLYTCRISVIHSPMCDCRGGEETVENAVMLCLKETLQRCLLHDEQGSQKPWNALTGKPLEARRLARWFINSNRIEEFSLAIEPLLSVAEWPETTRDLPETVKDLLEIIRDLIVVD